MTFYFFLIHQAWEMSSKGRGKLRSAGSIIILHPSASHMCQSLGLPVGCWAMRSSLKRLCLLNASQAMHLPSEHYMEVKHGGFSLGAWGRRKQAIPPQLEMPGPLLWKTDFPRGKGLAFQSWEAKIIFDAMETKQRTIVVCYLQSLNKSQQCSPQG